MRAHTSYRRAAAPRRPSPWNTRSCTEAARRTAWAAGTLVAIAWAAGCTEPEELPPSSELSAPLQSNGTIASARSAFSLTPASGVRLGFRPGAFSLSALDDDTHHFQGVARLVHGAYLVTTGSASSDLFVVDLASRSDSSTGRWGSNRPGGGAPPTSDRVISRLDLGAAAGYPAFDHAGGIQAIGDYVVVGLESLGATRTSLNSAVALVKVSAPAAPAVVATIDRTGQGTAGAAAITQLLDGRWLLAVGEFDSAKIDLYLGTGPTLEAASWAMVDTWSRDVAGGLCAEPGQDVSGDGYGAYQALHLFTQGDGAVYLIGSHRDPWGDDFADLYQVSFSGSLPPCNQSTTATGWRMRLTKVANKHLICTDTCNFDGGGGVYLDAAQQGFILYGTERLYGSSRGYLRMNEF